MSSLMAYANAFRRRSSISLGSCSGMGGIVIGGEGPGCGLLLLLLITLLLGRGGFLSGGAPVDIGPGGARGFGTADMDAVLGWTKPCGTTPPTGGAYSCLVTAGPCCGGSDGSTPSPAALPEAVAVLEAILTRRGDDRVGSCGGRCCCCCCCPFILFFLCH